MEGRRGGKRGVGILIWKTIKEPVSQQNSQKKNVLEQITGHAEVRGLPPETAYWVCAYANNQFELGADLGILRAPLLIVLRVALRAALLGGRN